MTTYRNELLSAHARIAQLEGRLAEKEGTSPPPPKIDASKNERPPEIAFGTPFWHAWPLPLLAIAIATYAVRFGASLPSWSLQELVPLERGSLLAAGVSSLLMVMALVLRVRSYGDSSVGQRLLTVVAAIISAPLLVAGALALLQVGSIIIGVIAAIATVVGAIAWVVRWIRDA